MIDMNTDVTEIGIKNLDRCNEEEFFAVGQTLARIEHGMQWAIGDWYNAIPWGDKEAACEKAGLNYITARHCGAVTAKFQMGARAPILGFKHHELLIIQELTDSQRDSLLKNAAKEHWTVKRLRTERDHVLGRPEKIPLLEFDDKVNAALADLPKSVSNKTRRAVRNLFSELKHRFQDEVEAEVKSRLKERHEKLSKIEREAEERRDQAIKMIAGVRAFMDEKEFKLVLSCLHPDRECAPTRKNKAFIIFKRLEETVREYR